MSRLSPVIMMVLMPISRSSSETLAHAWFDGVLEIDHAQDPRSVRLPPAACCPRRATIIDQLLHVVGERTALCLHVDARWPRRRPLRIWRPPRSTPLIRVWALNGTKVAPRA